MVGLRLGRRRLRRQAVLAERARGARRRRAAARRPCAAARASEQVPIELAVAADRAGDAAGVRARRGGRADPARVRPAAVPGAQSRPRVLARPADGCGLAVLLLLRHLDGHGPHPPPAGEDRGSTPRSRSTCRPCGASATGSSHERRPLARAPARHGDRAGGRWSRSPTASATARSSGSASRRSAPPCSALAHALARRRPRLGSLRRQFAVGVAVAVGQLVVLAAVAAQLMFVSAHDALAADGHRRVRGRGGGARGAAVRDERDRRTSRRCATRWSRWARDRARPPR